MMKSEQPDRPETAAAPRSAPGGARRSIATKVLVSASSLLMVLIVLMANYLSYRHYRRFDWTSQALFSLSDKSLAVLRALTSDVDIYLFLSRSEPNYADTQELLRRYEGASRHIRVHVTDPDREPAKFQMLAQRFGLGAALLENGQFGVDVAAVAAAGKNKWSIKRDDLVGYEWKEPGADRRGKVGR